MQPVIQVAQYGSVGTWTNLQPKPTELERIYLSSIIVAGESKIGPVRSLADEERAASFNHMFQEQLFLWGHPVVCLKTE